MLDKMTSDSKEDENGNFNGELFDSPEPASKKQSVEEMKSPSGESDLYLGENCLRPRQISFRSSENEDFNEKSTLIGKPDALDEKKEVAKTETTFGNNGLDMFSEKCLRSRKIPFFVVGGQNETKSSSTESPVLGDKQLPTRSKTSALSAKKEKNGRKSTSIFIGEPVPDEEARERWRWRYELKSQRSKGQSWILNADEEDETILNVECHYTQANVDGSIFSLDDCAYIRGNEGQKHVGRILEFFKTMEGEDYFRVQWFFRAEDTVIKEAAAFHDKKRLFYSTLMNDNLLDCIISKVHVGLKTNSIAPLDFYYDMEYCVEYSTFRNLLTDDSVKSHDLSSANYNDTLHSTVTMTPLEDLSSSEPCKAALTLLDLYSGCGGMSTGLCLGSRLSSVNIMMKWAVDFDRSACDSLKLNHPEAQVRNEAAEDFLELLKKWEKLCKWYVFDDLDRKLQSRSDDVEEAKTNIDTPLDAKIPAGEYEVSHLVDICYGDPNKTGKRGLKFKVRWKGWDSNEDTWEPIEGLSNCEERIRDFVRSGMKYKILPLPADVDVICGGPPCQGISGFNRFRNIDDPLADERNRQIIVFMDIVKFLKPKYVLMENVSDILRFDKASLGRYALSRLVHMRYQARLGTIAAGCYGLPQFRLRVFLWGALATEKLPQFPLPIYDVVVRYWPPPEFERNTVAYDEGQPRDLKEPVILRDAISDLPAVTNYEVRDQMMYERPPETEFQKYMRLTKYELMGFASSEVAKSESSVLYDHRPYQLFEDDYLRVCQIPHRKGANFRDLPGVVVGVDNVAHRDPKKESIILPSGKPLVPDYAFTFEQGKSKRPFARLWWDETVATVVTFPNCHNQAALHPEQDRILTIREYARLQGFPDFYRFCGSVRERYCQIGNAVAVPVSRALGFSLGMAFRKLSGDEPLVTLPSNFSFQPPPADEIVASAN
ncbi:unnamed protein product [Ilex paraguariensis]|uniref:DNA (cytosine-5-)-methyltransferase n=2 Tax=Ilex paraguariensis TaxID=185542 RepID=A0ABC8S7X2_9AQUA